jgi:FolB domain-containing protein
MVDERELDKIHIRDLTLRCIVGINDDERTKKQDVTINIALEADLFSARMSDDIKDTIDYKAVKQRVVTMVEESSYFLVERLAERIAELCLDDSKVERVRVTVEKPGALRFARTVAVEIVKSRPRGG